MKYYDLDKIKAFISKNLTQIDRIDIGIMEDWMDTNQRIFANGRLLVELPEAGKKVMFREIHGSMWGTPAMRVVYSDGCVDVVKCYFEAGPKILPSKRDEIANYYREKKGNKRLGWDGRFI